MPFDLIGFIVVLVLVIGVVMYSGKSAGISIIFSFFPTYLLHTTLPWRDLVIGYGRSPIEKVLIDTILFVLIFLITYIIVRKGISVVFPWTPIQKAFEIAVIAVMISGLIFSFTVKIAGVTSYIITPIMISVFNSTNSLFFWLAGCILALTLVLKR